MLELMGVDAAVDVETAAAVASSSVAVALTSVTVAISAATTPLAATTPSAATTPLAATTSPAPIEAAGGQLVGVAVPACEDDDADGDAGGDDVEPVAMTSSLTC